MKVRKDIGTQLEGAIEREKEANEALQVMKLMSDQKEEILEMGKAAKRSFEELFKQIHLTGKMEGQAIEVVTDTIQLLEERRKNAASMRDEIQNLRDQLDTAQNPGFISWVIRTVF